MTPLGPCRSGEHWLGVVSEWVLACYGCWMSKLKPAAIYYAFSAWPGLMQLNAGRACHAQPCSMLVGCHPSLCRLSNPSHAQESADSQMVARLLHRLLQNYEQHTGEDFSGEQASAVQAVSTYACAGMQELNP